MKSYNKIIDILTAAVFDWQENHSKYLRFGQYLVNENIIPDIDNLFYEKNFYKAKDIALTYLLTNHAR